MQEGRADLAMLPVENSTYGRIADIHHLLPESGLHIIGEHFVRVHANLLGVPGARLEDVRTAMSQAPLLGQCRAFLRAHGIAAQARAGHRRLGRGGGGDRRPDARRARLRARGRDLRAGGARPPHRGPVDQHHPLPGDGAARRGRPTPSDALTTFVFRVRNIPAALYKAMGGFATNGVNMTKLESYMLDGQFTATQFYADIEGHPDEPRVARALDELAYFTTRLQLLGVYPAHPFRRAQDDGAG